MRVLHDQPVQQKPQKLLLKSCFKVERGYCHPFKKSCNNHTLWELSWCASQLWTMSVQWYRCFVEDIRIYIDVHLLQLSSWFPVQSMPGREHESMGAFGAMAMGIPHDILRYPYFAKNPKTSLLCAGYHGSLWYPCLVEEDMRLAAMRRVPWGAGRRSWVALYCGFHRSWRRLHRFQLDGTAWQCHPSHLHPCKPGPAVRRDWREKRRTKMGGGGAKRRGGREWGD